MVGGKFRKSKPSVAERRAAKAHLLATSSADANRLAREKQEQRAEARQNAAYAERSDAYTRSHRLLYAEWIAKMSPEERAQVEAMGLQSAGLDEAESRNPAELPEVAVTWCPADAIDGIPEGENAIADAFCACLAWCSQSGALVHMGRRYLAMVSVLRPDLIDGLSHEVERGMVEEFHKATEGFPLAEIGEKFRKALHWARDTVTIGRVGQRVYAMLYFLRPRFIGAATLESIGALNNRTRQAVSKDVVDFQDCMRGMSSELTRGYSHRVQCQASKL